MRASRRVGLLVILGLVVAQAAVGQQPVVIPGPGSYEGRLEPSDPAFESGHHFDSYVLSVLLGRL
jgi:hypothetical protein